MSLKKILQGKKTYIIAIVVGIIAALKSQGIDIPEWVFAMLGALGLTALRAAVSRTIKE